MINHPDPELRQRAWGRVFISLLLLSTIGAAAYFGYQSYYWNDAYRQMQARWSQVSAQYAQSEAGLRQANRNIATVNAALRQTEAERNQAIAVVDRHAELLRLRKAQIQEANNVISEQGVRLMEQDAQLADSRQVNASLKNSVNELNASVGQLQTVNASLTEQVDSLEADQARLTRQINDLEQGNDRLRQEKEDLEAVNADLRRESENLNRQVATYRKSNTDLAARNRELTAALELARSRQINIPHCSSNYYTLVGGELSCVPRSNSRVVGPFTEAREVNLFWSGPVRLTINRPEGKAGSAHSMDLLEHAVVTIEQFMGEPLPTQAGEIRLDFVEELGYAADIAGQYKGTHIEVLHKYEANTSRRGEEALATIIAHEVAHYYWNNEKDWLDEGAAEFLADYSESRRTGQPIKAQRHPLCRLSSLRHLEQMKARPGDRFFTCNYSLGEGLFLDLYREMDENEFFRPAFRRLYASSQNKQGGIYQIRQAFYPETDWVQEIIDQWYGYRETPELHWPDGSFLAYYTWQEGGLWWHKTVDDKPCALRITYNEAAKYFTRHSYSLCRYAGEWDENDDLLVTIDGETYRAVELPLSENPDPSAHRQANGN